MKRVLTAMLAVCLTVTSVNMDAQAYYQGPEAVQEQQEGEESQNQDAQTNGQQESEDGQNQEEQDGKQQESKDGQNQNTQNEEQQEGEDGQNQSTQNEDQQNVKDDQNDQGGNQQEGEDGQNQSTQNEDQQNVKDDQNQNDQDGKQQDIEDSQNQDERSRKQQDASKELNYILMEKANLDIPDVQNVVASIGEAGNTIEDAVLTYKNDTTGETFTVKAAKVIEDMVLFSMKFDNSSQSGAYKLESIAYTANGIQKSIAFLGLDMNVAFGVNSQVDVAPDDIIYNEEALKEVEANVAVLDEDGNTVSKNTVESALQNADSEIPTVASSGGAAVRAVGAKKNLVVVLDPGHDDTHAGAQYNGFGEEDLVLKIAKYCRDELKKYSGVTVYMVREKGSCPYGAASAADCNAKRVEFAANKKADVYVSFHLNASTSSSANGVGVYYPNGSYRPDIGQEGKELATDIYQKLSALGLSTWAGGTLIHNSEDNSLYPDGSLADYLAIIRRSKLAGFPAVLIEHAFISSPSDVNNFLNSDAKLKKLGVADASAIAGYYGLKKAGIVPVIQYTQSQSGNKLKVVWNEVAGAESYEIYRSSVKDNGFSKIATIEGKSEYIDTEMQVGKRYYYKVRAVMSGDSFGDFSKAVAGRALQKAELNYVKSPITGKIQIGWKKIAGATGYYIYRCGEKSGKYQLIKKITSPYTTFYSENISQNGKTYYYKVCGISNNAGKGSTSNVKYATSIAKAKVTSAVAVSTAEMKLRWNRVDGANGYRVYRSTKKGGTYTKIKTITLGDTLAYNDKGLKKNTTYYYKVRAVRNQDGSESFGTYSNVYMGKTTAKTEITSLVSKSSTILEINWKKVPGAYGYKIRRSTSKDGSYKEIAVIKGSNTLKYQDKSLTSGNRYYYRITTLNKVNGRIGSSGYCTYKSAVPMEKTSIISVSSRYSSSIEIRWKKVSGAYLYKVKRGTSEKGSYTTIASVKGKNNTIYRDNSRVSGKRYYYKVEVVSRENGSYGYSGNSKVVSGKSLLKPDLIGVKTNGSGQIILNWKKSYGADFYEVRRSNTKNGTYELVASLKKSDTVTYIDKSVTSGKTYYYKIRACQKINGKNGYSSYCKEVKAWTPKKVILTNVLGNNGESVTLSWGNVANASGYRIQRSTSPKSGFKVIKTISSGTTCVYTDRSIQKGTIYYYRVAALNKIVGVLGRGDYSEVKSASTGYTIMGESSVSVNDMVSYYNARYKYPTSVYAAKGAPNIQSFCTILKQEAEDEGVRAEVLFAQVMLETGGLQYKGDVKIEQCNFGGLGATGNGVTGEVFPNVRTGLRAQVQHLKAYASTDALKKKCVDNRFKYVRRGTAPYVEWLTILKNPYGTGWAMDPVYDVKLLKIIWDVI